MNIRQLTLLVVVALVAAIITFLLISKGFISLSDTTLAKPSTTPEVTFKIEGDGLEITSITNGTDSKFRNCKNTSNKKCFRVKRGHAGLVAYTFDNEYNDNDDDDDWVLTQFTICRGLDKIKTKCTAELDRNERLEFFIMNNKQGDKTLLTPKSGQIDLKLLGNKSLRTFFLFDQNTIKRDYFYNIQVCKGKDEDKTCLTLDPPFENKGRR